jgi:DNA-binding CsgD family transcriptional regulator
MTDIAGHLSQLICDIYDAAIDASCWSAVVGEAARFVGGSSAVLFSKDTASGAGNLHCEFGTDPYYLRLYLEKNIRLDPATIDHFFAKIEQPIVSADLMPYHEFLQTRFYREWAQPQGVVDFVAAALERSASTIALFGVFRHERDGPVDQDTLERMRLVIPHIRRAVLVGRLINLKAAEAATFADTLDGLTVGIFLVDANGRIVHANAPGRTILDAGDLLSEAGGYIVARDGKIDKTLRELFAAAGGGDMAIGSRGVAQPLRAQNGTHYVAYVLPLATGARRLAGTAYSSTAVLFVRKSAIELASSSEIIARAYSLTPTELRVLLAIVEVGGVPEVAAVLGVAETTVRTHLGHLFEKTATNRQADLVKIVAGFSTPFAG